MPELGKATYVVDIDSRSVGPELAATEATINRSLARIGGRLNTIGSRMTSVGRGISTGFTLPLAAVGTASALMAVKFEDEMGKIRDSAGASADEVKRMTENILDMSGSGEFTHGPQELSEALYRVESAGIRGGEAMDILKIASHGAMLGASDLQTTTLALVAAVKTGIAGAEDYDKAMGTLTSTVGAGNMRMDDLAGAMSTGILPAARAMGLSLLDVGAALAVFTSRNVPAQAAATRLRMTFSQMAAPTAKAKKALEEIGIGEMELANAMRGPGGLPAAVKLLHDRLQTIPDETKRTQLVLQAFGGGRTGAAMLILLQNMDDLGVKFDQIGGKAGQFDKLVEEALQGPAENVEKAWAAIQASLIRTGFVLLPMIADIAAEVADAAEWFGKLSDETKKWIFIIGGAVAILGPLLVLFGTMTIAIGGIITAVSAIAALGLPFLAVAAAVAVLVAALVAAKVAPEQLEAVLVKLGFTSEQAAVVVKGLGIAFEIIWAQISFALNNIRVLVGSVFQFVRGYLDLIIGVLTLDFAQAWKGIVAIVTTPLNTVKGIVKNAVETIKGLLGKMWDGIKEQALEAALAIVEPFSHLPGFLGGWARKAKDAMLAELAEIDAAKYEEAAAKLAENFGHIVVPKFGVMGTQAGQTFGTNMMEALLPSLNAVPDAAGKGAGPMARWNERKQKWVDEAGKVIKDQQAAWDALLKKHGGAPKPKPGETVALETPPPATGGGGGGGGDEDKEPGNILPADLRLREAQAEGNLNAQIQVYRAEQDYLRRLLANKRLGVERRIEITNELNRVNGALAAAMDELNEEVIEEAWQLPRAFVEREKVVNATKQLGDDARFYRNEEKFLMGLLKNKKLSAEHKSAIRDELRRVRAEIAKLNDDIWEQKHSQPLWTAKMEIRRTKAERTERLDDDLKVQQDEMKYLKRLLRGLGTSKRDMERRAQIEAEITKTMQNIANIRKEQREAAEDEQKERKAMERMFFQERASFFSSFGSSVFRQGAPEQGAPEPSRTPGSGIPGFATGGPVPGRGVGDIVEAKLTPGEWILNRAQQRRIADALGVGVKDAARVAFGGRPPQQQPPDVMQRIALSPPPPARSESSPRGEGRPVVVHQHFPERTQNLNREAMYAEQAFRTRFEDDQ